MHVCSSKICMTGFPRPIDLNESTVKTCLNAVVPKRLRCRHMKEVTAESPQCGGPSGLSASAVIPLGLERGFLQCT